MTGALIGERYLLGDLLGKGGMADVNQAHDIRLKRQVAVKRINAERAGDANSRERFRLEAEAAARLNHPNIVAVYDAGEYQDQDSQKMVPYIVMELVKGKTIRQMIESGTKFTPTKVLEITATILEALDYSHEQGIVHRDIKPSNVMITHTGQVKVMDFGIARIDPDQAITQEATVLGTPQYFSPEQITGQVVDRRSDIYSTGCMLYELLTGQLPFDGGTATDIAIQHVRGIAVPPSEINPALSPAYDALCAKAMAKSLTERYQTAGAMRDDITRLLGGAVPPSPTSAEQPTVALTQADVTLPPSAAHRTTVLPTQTKVAPPVASQGAIPLRRLSPAPAKTLAPAPKERLSRSKWAFPTSATPNDRTRQIAAPSLTRTAWVSPTSLAKAQTRRPLSSFLPTKKPGKVRAPAVAKPPRQRRVKPAPYQSWPPQPGWPPPQRITPLKDRIKARVFPSVIVVALVLGAISGALVWLGKNDVRDPAEVTINGTVYSTALTDLSLKGLGLDDDDIAPLKYMTKLISLNLADNEITDLSALSGLTKLWYLNLNNNEIEDLDPLMEVSSLFIVLVLGNPVDSDQVAELRETLPHCLVLAF